MKRYQDIYNFFLKHRTKRGAKNRLAMCFLQIRISICQRVEGESHQAAKLTDPVSLSPPATQCTVASALAQLRDRLRRHLPR
jgi:hypothetical protein